MPPVIKVYEIPNSAKISGIYDPNPLNNHSIEDENLPDIQFFFEEEVLPVVQAKDFTNIPQATEIINEQPHELKAKLAPIDVNDPDELDFMVDATGSTAGGSEWVTTHIHEDYIPSLFFQQPHTYFANSVESFTFSYTHIPLYNINRAQNYTLDAFGQVHFTQAFQDECLDGAIVSDTNGSPIAGSIKNLKPFASFWYWQPRSADLTGLDAEWMPPYGDYVDMSSVLIKWRANDIDPWEEVHGIGVIDPEGEPFDKDVGSWTWSDAPIDSRIIISGYRHTWKRILNFDLQDLAFLPGETATAVTAPDSVLVKDLSVQHPWYVYTDFKVVNESGDVSLEKFFLLPIVRGQLDIGQIIAGAQGLVDIKYPWDQQTGGAIETTGYTGVLTSGATQNIATIMVWEVGNGTPEFPNWCLPFSLPIPNPVVPLSIVDEDDIGHSIDGQYRYSVTFVIANQGETDAIETTDDVISANEAVNIHIPLGDEQIVTGRRIYRSRNKTSNDGDKFLLIDIPDNTTLTHRDIVDDDGLTLNILEPTSNTTSGIRNGLEGIQETFRQKFPIPCLDSADKGARHCLYFWDSTRQDAADTLSFIATKHNFRFTGQNLWKQNVLSTDRMILPSGSFSPVGEFEGFPRPGTVFGRMIWSYRDFNQATGAWQSGFESVAESIGSKDWTLKIQGKYFEDL